MAVTIVDAMKSLANQGIAFWCSFFMGIFFKVFITVILLQNTAKAKP